MRRAAVVSAPAAWNYSIKLVSECLTVNPHLCSWRNDGGFAPCAAPRAIRLQEFILNARCNWPTHPACSEFALPVRQKTGSVRRIDGTGGGLVKPLADRLALVLQSPRNVRPEVSTMSMHRMKCRNSQCHFEGMMEAKSEQPFVRKAFLDKQKEDRKSKGIAAPASAMQVRCPKCGTRWRMRGDQLR